MKKMESKKKNMILRALNVTRNKNIEFSGENYLIGELIDNDTRSINILSNACLSVFNGNSINRGGARNFDFLAYGDALIKKKAGIITELKKQKTAYNQVVGPTSNI